MTCSLDMNKIITLTYKYMCKTQIRVRSLIRVQLSNCPRERWVSLIHVHAGWLSEAGERVRLV